MSKYTTEVRFICETEAGYDESKGFNSLDAILTASAPKVFNFSFPIFDENYRLPLEKKILRHYYTREICEETVGLWKLRLQDRLCMIMPYYNKLYESELLEFDPLRDVDITRDHVRENQGTSSGTGSSETVSSGSTTTEGEGVEWRLYSDTPQGGINGITADNDSVANNTYLTNATKTTNNDTTDTVTEESSATETSENAEVESTEEYLEHVFGKQGTISYSKMLEEFRNTFLNIDRMIIDDLSDLFFGLW